MSLMPIRLEQVSTSVSKDDRSVVGAECGRAQQTLLFEVALSSAGVLAAIMEIALGHDAEGTDGGQHAAFGAVDLVHAIAFSDWSALTAPRQIEVLRKHVSLMTLVVEVSLSCAASAADVAVPAGTAIAMTIMDIVSVPHFRLDFRRSVSPARFATLPSMAVGANRSQPTFG